MGVFRWSGPIHYKGGENGIRESYSYYIGIDVHKRKCVATIKENAKEILKQVEFENDVKGINGFIGMIRREGRMPATAVCESTGNYWIVLHDTLEEAGIDTLLAHPHHIKVITQTFYKNDKTDSEKLAELLRLDVVPESFVANRSQRDLRELTRTRTGLQQNTSTPRNRIYAILAKYPHTLPDHGLFTNDGRDWLRDVQMSEIDRMVANCHLAVLDCLSAQVFKLEERIAQISLTDWRARLIMTIPGIGHITAVTILAEIVDHRRFTSAEKLVSYAGLSPRHHNSGETERTGSITKRGSVWLRRAMVEAAIIAIRHDTRIRGQYHRLAPRIGAMKARVAIARKMLEWVWEMLESGTEYRTKNDELVKRKIQRIKRIAAS